MIPAALGAAGVATLTAAASVNPGQRVADIIQALIVAGILGGTAAVWRLGRRLSVIEQGLALLVQQVSPPGAPALRELVHGQAVDLATLKGQIVAAQATATTAVAAAQSAANTAMTATHPPHGSPTP